jgi:protein regulator of cytokinesis 1
MDSSTSKQRFSSPAVKFMLGRSSILSPSSENSNKSPSNSFSNHNTQLQNPTTNHNDRSMFTPILTPSVDNRGASMVLLSPSRTITETLTSLASNTGHQLEDIWDEVGYSPEDRAAQLSDLLVKFRDICEQKIAEESQVAETFRQTIAEAKEEIRSTAAALKIDPDSSTSNILNETRTPQTLTDELATLEATLEGLRATAETAKADLKECLNYLIDAHDALGLDLDPSWRDIESDLTTSRREAFHQKKAEMKNELSTRMAAVIQLVRDCQQLMNDLRMEPERDGSELDRQIAGSLVRSKHGSFIMASKFQSDTCIGISSKALEALTQRVASLHSEKRRRKVKLQEMGAEIAILWEKLHIPEEEQLAFTKSVTGLGIDTIEKGEKELNRLRSLKSQMLGKLIEESRQTIEELWKQINAMPDMKRSFASFYVKDESLYDDELLEKHEDYIETLEARLEQMKPILRLIERREVILAERIEYEEIQKDSDRLKQRGAELTKQLMAEEKMAKRIKRDLPKMTDHLREKLLEWKQHHGEDFQFKGEVYLKVMDRQEEEWRLYKEVEMQRKLKKKQEERAFVESHNNLVVKKRSQAKPLGEGTRHNVPQQQQLPNNKVKSRAQSHAYESKAPPVRTLGSKQTSARL